VGILKSSVLVDIANYVGLPLLAIYCLSMFLYPWVAGNGSWEHVQAVWDRWQSLNTGALAFVASLIAFNISRFNEHRQRERDFIAAKAFLPSTLSGLMEYFSRCAQIYEAIWNSTVPTTAPVEVPAPPNDYREVFSNCIRHGDPAVGSYLSNILVQLQVHEARLLDAVAPSTREHDPGVDRYALIGYVFRLGELYSLMGNLFGFARGEKEFRSKSLTWDDLRSAYKNLNFEIEEMYIDEVVNLEAFTKRRLDRIRKQSLGSESDA
jgi:hypothetical protein